jgi:hypothetical protein
VDRFCLASSEGRLLSYGYKETIRKEEQSQAKNAGRHLRIRPQGTDA